jgi:O-antigen/teichoic acid export membrane protein
MTRLFNNHIIMSGLYKGISGMSLFVSIRLLMLLLNNEGYGIWVLIFTVFQMVLLMDFGIQSTLKTKIPVFIHHNESEKIGQFINNTYKSTGLLALIIFIIFFVINYIVDLKSAFNINGLNKSETQILFLLNIGFFCVSFIANIHKSLYVAFLKGKYSEQSIAVNQILFLTFVLLFYYFPSNNLSLFEKLLFISIGNGCVTLIVNLIYTICFFRGLPQRFNFFQTKFIGYIKDVLPMGLKFMIIQLGFLFVFSADGYIISNAFNPKEVVAYEIVSKLYQFPYMILFAALSPLWSMFAKDYLEKNKIKLHKDFQKFNWYFLGIVLSLLLLYIITPFVISIWIKEQIHIPNYLIELTVLVTLLKIFVSFYTFFLNGVGKLNIYLVILVGSVLVKIPLSYWFIQLGAGINSVLFSSLILVLVWCIILPFYSLNLVRNIK